MKSTAFRHKKKKNKMQAPCATQFRCPHSTCAKGQGLSLHCRRECLSLERKKVIFSRCKASICNASHRSPALKDRFGCGYIEMKVCSGNFQLAADSRDHSIFILGQRWGCCGLSQGKQSRSLRLQFFPQPSLSLLCAERMREYPGDNLQPSHLCNLQDSNWI